MKKPPAEIVASALAVTTIFISMLPWHLPPWAIFIAWAGTFAAGGPTPPVMRKLWITMPIGAVTAFLIVIGFRWADSALGGAAALFAHCIILFCLNGMMMSLGRIPAIGFVPGMFFGFACFFATWFGKFGPDPTSPALALIACLAMNFLGPVYAWLTARLSAHHGPEGKDPTPA